METRREAKSVQVIYALYCSEKERSFFFLLNWILYFISNFTVNIGFRNSIITKRN